MTTSLPDEPYINQLARALWGEGEFKGAAVMVGSGFSLNAEFPSPLTPKPPLWPELSEAMAGRLYGEEREGAPQDPLRLAEEYRAYFGQSGLNEFIRSQIRDDSWLPGPLHKELLELPWAEVLTTNWDTLLERAGQGIETPHYSVVSSQIDLAHYERPRIVKLHGSIQNGTGFTFAEEDYRRYPSENAAFVNFARQCFLENELCLVGFSGNDPNFLSWTGWVRDQLAGEARRIYLVGALRLSAATRQLLEKRNIAPIDLAPWLDAGDADSHAKAIHLFLGKLRDARPRPRHEWDPGRFSGRDKKSDQDIAAALREATQIWSRARRSYPGWLVCPRQERVSIRFELLDLPSLSGTALALLKADEQTNLARELAWRFKISNLPLRDDVRLFLRGQAPKVEKLADRVEVLEVVARDTRRHSNSDDFGKAAAAMRDIPATTPGDPHAIAVYETCLLHRRNLEWPEVSQLVDQIVGHDPIWALRRAFLLFELGRAPEASQSIQSGLADIRSRQLLDRKSLWLLSRRAWIEYLARAVHQSETLSLPPRDWPLDFRDFRCDPFQAIEQTKSQVSEDLDRKREARVDKVASFTSGHYVDRSEAISFRSSGAENSWETSDFISEFVGVPTSIGYVSILSSVVEGALEAHFDGSERWYKTVLNSFDGKIPKKLDVFFSRVSIAKIDGTTIRGLVDVLQNSIKYYIDSGAQSDLKKSSKLVLHLDILGRLSVRLDPESARDVFKFLVEYLKFADVSDANFGKTYNSALTNCLSAMDDASKVSVFDLVIEFPYLQERGNKPSLSGWPSLIDDFFDVTPTENIERIISQQKDRLINALRAEGQDRTRALLIIFYANKNTLLKRSNIPDFASEIWKDDNVLKRAGMLPHELYPHYHLGLPRGPDHDVLTEVRQELFEEIPAAADYARIDRIAAAGRVDDDALRVVPPPDKAFEMFSVWIDWRPQQSGREAGGLGRILGVNQREERDSISNALVFAVAPNLPTQERNRQSLSLVIQFIDEADAPIALAALPFFCVGDPDVEAQVRIALEKGLRDYRKDWLSGAVLALERWATSTDLGLVQIPETLVEQGATAFFYANVSTIPALSWMVRAFLKGNFLSEEWKEKLRARVLELGEIVSYERCNLDNPDDLINMPVARAELTRLVAELFDASSDERKNWLAAAVNDPLPEVRRAAQLT